MYDPLIQTPASDTLSLFKKVSSINYYISLIIFGEQNLLFYVLVFSHAFEFIGRVQEEYQFVSNEACLWNCHRCSNCTDLLFCGFSCMVELSHCAICRSGFTLLLVSLFFYQLGENVDSLENLCLYVRGSLHW